MYENYTPEKIRQDILDNTGAEVSTEEGSFASDMAAPVALEMSKLYGVADAILTGYFLETLTGANLEKRASEFGIIRKDGVKATGTVVFTGNDGKVIPQGTQLTTNNGIIFVTDEAVTIANGTATVDITAMNAGAAYNVPENTIVYTYRSISGVSSVTNPSATIGGADPETDEDLRKRILIRLQTPATSGNAYHYYQWALSVDGVGDAKVIPLARGAGTVDVMLVSPTKEPVSQDVVDACSDYIETVRPIGADVDVYSADAKTINVAASVTVDSSTTKAEVQSKFADALNEYFHESSFKVYTLSINRVAYLLMSIDGVTDYSTLTINGSAASVTIADDEVPVLGTVVVS